MSHVGQVVSKFQARPRKTEQSSPTKENDSPRARAAAPEQTGSHNDGEGPSPQAPPGGKSVKKPAPLPKTGNARVPPGVQIRKQPSTEKRAPLRKQNSTSFTTEDLDLFQNFLSEAGYILDISGRKRAASARQKRPVPTSKTPQREVKRHDGDSTTKSGTSSQEARKSRRDSSSASKDGLQHRSKSAGAFANRGLRHTPTVTDKPQVPTKPKPKVPGKTGEDRPVELRKKQVNKSAQRTSGSGTSRTRTSGTRPSSRSSPSTPRDGTSARLPPSGREVNQNDASATQTKNSSLSSRRRGSKETRIPKLRSQSKPGVEPPKSTVQSHACESKPSVGTTSGSPKPAAPPPVSPKPCVNKTKADDDTEVKVSSRPSSPQVPRKAAPPVVSPKPAVKVNLTQSSKVDVTDTGPPGQVSDQPSPSRTLAEETQTSVEDRDATEKQKCQAARATLISALTAAQTRILPRRSGPIRSFVEESTADTESGQEIRVDCSLIDKEHVISSDIKSDTKPDPVPAVGTADESEKPPESPHQFPVPESPQSPSTPPGQVGLTRKKSRKESLRRPNCSPPPPPSPGPSNKTLVGSSSPQSIQSPRLLESCTTFEGKAGSPQSPEALRESPLPASIVANTPSGAPRTGSPRGTPTRSSPRNTPTVRSPLGSPRNTPTVRSPLSSPRNTPTGGSPQHTPSGSPKLSHSKLMKVGLTERGHDVSPAQLIQERIIRLAGRDDRSDQSSNEEQLPSQSILTSPQINIISKKDSPVSSDSERPPVRPQQSDSNDADDEDEHVNSHPATTSPGHVLLKSFSTGQEDVTLSSHSLNVVTVNRPSSMVSSISTGSTASTESQRDKKKSKGKNGEKKNIIEGIMRKLSRAKDDIGGSDEDWKTVGKTKFYGTEEGKSDVSKDLETRVGKAVFYKDIDEAKSSDVVAVSEVVLEDREGNKGPELPEKDTPGRQFPNNMESVGVSGELNRRSQTSGDVPYENMMFGPVYEGIEVHKNQAGRNDLLDSAMNISNDTVTNQHSVKDSKDDTRDQSPTTGTQNNSGLDTQQGLDANGNNTIADEQKTEENLQPSTQDFPQTPVYENIEITVQKKRSTWRRKTLRRRTPKRRNVDGREDHTEEEGTYDEFENFSDSDFDFDSDSFTDEDSEFEKEIYQSLESSAPVEEGPPTNRLHHIANELLSTERAYVDRLHLIDQIFHFRVLMENRAQHMFPDDVIPQMFSNIKSIYQFHHDFLLPQLVKRMEAWDSCPKVGDLMKKFAPFLKLYSEYVKNFDHAMNMISTWQERSPVFANIMVEVQKKPECGMLTLQHHMLEPIQRVPRYELLLKDYLKHLPEDSDDRTDTEKALELVTTAATHSNEAMRKMEKFRKLLELNEKFGGMIDLIDPTRELMKEGKMVKISARNGVHYDRYLFLFNDMLLVCQTHIIGLLHHYRIKTKLDIEGMQVLEGDNLQTPDTFYIKSKTKTIEMLASSSGEKMEWQVMLWNVIADFTKKQMSRQAGLKSLEAFQEDQLGVRAPTWVKDQNTSMCMQCGCAFSVIKRRHHCRCCGIVVCAKCSSHKWALPYQDNKPDRVCDKCYRTLSGRRDRAMSIRRQNNAVTRKRGVLQVKGSDDAMISSHLLMSTDRKTWERRWFAAHRTFVLYSFKAPQDVHAMTSMPLPGYEVQEVTKDDHVDRENVLKLFHKGQKKAYYFQAEDRVVLQKWLSILSQAVLAKTPDTSRQVDTKVPLAPTDSTC